MNDSSQKNPVDDDSRPALEKPWQKIASFEIQSQPGNELLAMEAVTTAVQSLNFPDKKLEKLRTAVAETTMNAMEYGNQYQPDRPVYIDVILTPGVVAIHIRDHGGNIQLPEPEKPDLEAKLAGRQSPRGWGLFIIRNMVDELRIIDQNGYHTVELLFHIKGGEDAG